MPGKHAIAIRLGQPFDQHHINVLEDLAPINIYGMLDTIAEDCGHLSITQELGVYWDHVARHANGLFFISQFSETTFCARFPEARALPKYTRLLPTRVSSYTGSLPRLSAQHVLILGNHFPHKASDSTATILAKSFPTVQFVVLGGHTGDKGNLRGYRAGTLEPETVSTLFARASVVVLPSHIEGFGFGLMHALAARKPIVARNIEATKEILGTFKATDGVYLYDNDSEIKDALVQAMKQTRSTVDDSAAYGWDEWVGGFATFLRESLNDQDLFGRLCDRIRESDLVRKSLGDVRMNASADNVAPPVHLAVSQSDMSLHVEGSIASVSNLAPAKDVDSLLQHDGPQFVEQAYQAILQRRPDPEGLSHYLTQLRSGITKIQVLSSIQNSTEGKTVGKELVGLRRANARDKLSRLPIFKHLVHLGSK